MLRSSEYLPYCIDSPFAPSLLAVDLTDSYKSILPSNILRCYEICEIRNAAALLAATNREEFDDIVAVLDTFRLTEDDVLGAGGNKSKVARRLDEAFRERGWREARHDTELKSILTMQPYRAIGERHPEVVHDSLVLSEGYKVDNVRGRVALDVEWNAKDGNLDRDLAAYRALYDAGIIDAGAIITRSQSSLREYALALDPLTDKFKTTTTTNIEKLEPRLTRGDSGGCPVVAFAITAECAR